MTSLGNLKSRGRVTINQFSGCIEWGAGKSSGYGRLRISGRMKFAHREAYELHYGAIPNCFHVLHRCDNPACINPEHLFLGTHADNMADKSQKERQARGEGNGIAKLSEADVLAIRQAGGVTQRALAREYGVNQAQIWRIQNRKQWKHLPPKDPPR